MGKVKINREECISCGTCAAMADDIFEMADDGKAAIKGVDVAPNQEKDLEDVSKAKETAESCPVTCILIEE